MKHIVTISLLWGTLGCSDQSTSLSSKPDLAALAKNEVSVVRNAYQNLSVTQKERFNKLAAKAESMTLAEQEEFVQLIGFNSVVSYKTNERTCL